MTKKKERNSAVPPGYDGPLKWMWWKGHRVAYNLQRGVTLNFFKDISNRVKKRLSTKMIVVGEAGIGKTYLAIALAMLFDPKFSVDQIIFGHEDYLDLSIKLPEGRWITLDEPSYVIGHREWYNEINKILVHAIESDRFLVHPLIISIINQSLLDKTVREHLIQYMIWVTDRGKARVYRIRHSQFVDKTYYDYVCDLRILTPKTQLATCNRDTCLGCKQLGDCDKFIWPQYERKRIERQMQRYSEGKKEIEQKMQKKLTFKERVQKAWEDKENLRDENGEYDITLIMTRHEVSQSYAYRIKDALKYREMEEPKNG